MATPNASALNFVGGGGLKLPPHDYEAFTYTGAATNNVATIIGKVGGASGTTVGTLTFTYVAAGVADDDDVLTVTLSTPNPI